MMNYTIVVSDGTTSHGTTNLLCVPPRWLDYLSFFIGNYLAHAATVGNQPGATLTEIAFTVLSALFVPGSGAVAAVPAIMRHAGTARKNDLRQAALAGALCMVVKTGRIQRLRQPPQLFDVPRKPVDIEKNRSVKSAVRLGGESPTSNSWFDSLFKDSQKVNLIHPDRNIHGFCSLPAGYCLVKIRKYVPLKEYSSRSNSAAPVQLNEIRLARTYNIPKIFTAMP